MVHDADPDGLLRCSTAEEDEERRHDVLEIKNEVFLIWFIINLGRNLYVNGITLFNLSIVSIGLLINSFCYIVFKCYTCI